MATRRLQMSGIGGPEVLQIAEVEVRGPGCG